MWVDDKKKSLSRRFFGDLFCVCVGRKTLNHILRVVHLRAPHLRVLFFFVRCQVRKSFERQWLAPICARSYGVWLASIVLVRCGWRGNSREKQRMRARNFRACALKHKHILLCCCCCVNLRVTVCNMLLSLPWQQNCRLVCVRCNTDESASQNICSIQQYFRCERTKSSILWLWSRFCVSIELKVLILAFVDLTRSKFKFVSLFKPG